MGNLFFDKFYLFFQGVLVFQAFFLAILYIISKKKDILYYSLFLFLLAIYFFINAPQTYFNIDDDTVFSSPMYIYSNTPLIIVSNIVYILFLRSFFSDLYYNSKLNTLYRLILLALPLLIITSLVLVYFKSSNQVVFYLLNLLISGLCIYILIDILKNKIAHSGWVGMGIFFNIIGTGLTVCMIVLERQNVRNILTVDYPLFFMRCGILADIFFYQIAILKKWQFYEKQLTFKLIEKELAVERVRNQISGQLHDDIGSTLSGVSMYSHLASDLFDNGKKSEAKKSLLVIQDSVDDMVEKLGDLVWSMNPKQQSPAQFFERIEQYAIQMCNVKNIQLKIVIPDAVQNIAIPVEQRHHIYLVMKEAINNAVKYSNATLLELTVTEVDGKLQFSVSDNGKAFDALLVRRGNGLENMQKRADEIGATFILQSKENKGVSVSLHCKIT